MKKIFLRTKFISSGLGDSFRIIPGFGSVTPSFATRLELQSGIYLTVEDNFSFITLKPLPGSLCPDYSVDFYLPNGSDCFPDKNDTPAPTPDLCVLRTIDGVDSLSIIGSLEYIKPINC